MNKLLLTTFLLLLTPVFIHAQHMLQGSVVDEKSSEPLIGADIYIIGVEHQDTIAVASTDEAGAFEIRITPSRCHLIIDYFGYSMYFLEDINLEVTKVLPLIRLKEADVRELEQHFVEGVRDNSNVRALYDMQKQTPVMSNGISSDVIAKSPDRNMGEVLKRVSGASVQDNKFVVIRGMGDRYNMATLDGAVLPSTEMNKKAFAFDMIPSFAVDQLVVYKAGKADMPSEFAGGLINIQTRSIPNSKFTQVSIGGSVNTVSTFKDFQTQSHTAADFLSFGKGDRKLPSSLPSYSQMNDSRYYHPNRITENIPYINDLNNDFSTLKRTALPGMNFQISNGNKFITKNRGVWGYIAGLTLSHDETIQPNVLRYYDNYSYNDNAFAYRSSVSGLLNIGYKSDKTILSWTNLFNNAFEDRYLERTGINWGTSSNIQYYALDVQQKTFFKSGINLTRQLGNKGVSLNTVISTTFINNDQPDQKKLSYTQNMGSTEPYSAALHTVGRFNNRLYAQVKENITSAQVDLTIPTTFLRNTIFKVGASEVVKFRDLSNRYLGLLINESTELDREILNQPKENIFSETNINNGSFKLIDQSNDGDFYKAQTYTTSAYGMADYNYGKNRVVAGVRMEHYGMTFDALRAEDDYKISWFNILPSLSWNYSINDKMLSRLAYFASTIRPEIREMAPLGYYDYDMNAMITGNPGLKPTTIHNIDYKWELYPDPTELLSAGVFYKYFMNTIENRVYAANTSYDIDPQNFNKAYNLGVEVEMRKNIGKTFNAEALDDWSVYLNATYTYSRTQLPENFYILGNLMTERPLSAQAPWMVNAGLYYTHPENKYAATLLYNFIDRNIHMLGHDRIGHVYLNARHLLDFQFSVMAIKDWTIKLNVRDILNSPITYFIDQNSNGKLDKVSRDSSQPIDIYKDWIWQEFRPGTTFSLSFQYKF